MATSKEVRASQERFERSTERLAELANAMTTGNYRRPSDHTSIVTT